MQRHARKQIVALLRPHSGHLMLGAALLIITAGLNVPIPILSMNLINSIVSGESVTTPFGVYVSLFLSMLLVRELLIYFSHYLFETKIREFVASLRRLIFETFQYNYETFSSYESGRILTYIHADPERLQEFFHPTAIRFLKDMLAFIFALAVGFYLNVAITIISLLPLLVFFVLVRLVNPIIRKLTSASIESQTEFVSRLKEYIDGMEMCRVYLRERFSVEKFTEFNTISTSAGIKRARSVIVFNLPLSILFNAGYFLTLLIGAYYVKLGEMEIGSLFAILMAVSNIYDSSKNLWDFNVHLREVNVVEDRLSEVLDERYVSKRRSRGPERFSTLGTINTIRVNIPTFTYGDGKSLLEGIDIEANRGEIVGLIGKSGRGKSTLIRIILGLLDTDADLVMANGIPLHQIEPDEFYSRVGYVPQQPVVFKGTVRENILLGLDGKIEDEILQILDDLALDREVEEGGRNLSGGEIQRIALSRAFVLPHRDLYLLDEPTAHLDSNRQEKVMELIRHRAENSIVLVVSHSLDLLEDLVHRIVEL